MVLLVMQKMIIILQVLLLVAGDRAMCVGIKLTRRGVNLVHGLKYRLVINPTKIESS